MPSILNPYLSFTSNAREAMDFYRSVFGGEVQVVGDAERRLILRVDALAELRAVRAEPVGERGRRLVVAVDPQFVQRVGERPEPPRQLQAGDVVEPNVIGSIHRSDRPFSSCWLVQLVVSARVDR